MKETDPRSLFSFQPSLLLSDSPKAMSSTPTSSGSKPMAAAAAVEELKTAPYDHRFPSQNQARHCFTRYCEYFKCMERLDDEDKCRFYKSAYQQLCPGDWVEQWDEARGNGSFPYGKDM